MCLLRDSVFPIRHSWPSHAREDCLVSVCSIEILLVKVRCNIRQEKSLLRCFDFPGRQLSEEASQRTGLQGGMSRTLQS